MNFSNNQSIIIIAVNLYRRDVIRCTRWVIQKSLLLYHIKRLFFPNLSFFFSLHNFSFCHPPPFCPLSPLIWPNLVVSSFFIPHQYPPSLFISPLVYHTSFPFPGPKCTFCCLTVPFSLFLCFHIFLFLPLALVSTYHVLLASAYASFPTYAILLALCPQPLPLPPPFLTALYLLCACSANALPLFFLCSHCCFMHTQFLSLLLPPPITCFCPLLPISCLSSAHGGLPPTPAAGVPCPPPARHGYRGQAHQAAGQLLRGGDPKDGCLSLWGGH